MLSPEHVRVRRRAASSSCAALDRRAARARGRARARGFSDIAASHVGKAREEVERAVARDRVRRRASAACCRGLMKLARGRSRVRDARSASIRRRCAASSSSKRPRAAAADEPNAFDRDGAASPSSPRARGIDAGRARSGALRRSARRAPAASAAALPGTERSSSEYERGQVQAVLLRAVRVVADVRCASPDAYRELFRKLKFRRPAPPHRAARRRRLPHRDRRPVQPVSEASPKYGLELALVLPALEACDELELVAEVRWSDERTLAHVPRTAAAAQARERGAPALRDGGGGARRRAPRARPGWDGERQRAHPRAAGRRRVRARSALDSSARRRRGLRRGARLLERATACGSASSSPSAASAQKILFAVSSRLRVSEEVLDESESAALYVYKGKMNPQALFRKVEDARDHSCKGGHCCGAWKKKATVRRIAVIGGGLAGLVVAFRRCAPAVGSRCYSKPRRDSAVSSTRSEPTASRSSTAPRDSWPGAKAVRVLASDLGIESNLVGQLVTKNYAFDGRNLAGAPRRGSGRAARLSSRSPRARQGHRLVSIGHGRALRRARRKASRRDSVDFPARA